MSEFEIAIALFDFIKTFELNAEQQAYFDALKKAWNSLQDGENEEMSECETCGYYWQDEDEDYPCCHYNDPWPAPCEYDDEPIEEEEENDPCIGCPHEGFGSEHCAAGIGDYCRAGRCIIEE